MLCSKVSDSLMYQGVVRTKSEVLPIVQCLQVRISLSFKSVLCNIKGTRLVIFTDCFTYSGVPIRIYVCTT
uniref:Uncharacterized protein n=1 Tax=Helianthus annuus TaxID=4232 RepID=A0A251S8X2_HELAN